MTLQDFIAKGRAAASALSEFKQLYEQVAPALSADEEAEIAPVLAQLRVSNDELSAAVEAKLRAAAQEPSKPPFQ